MRAPGGGALKADAVAIEPVELIPETSPGDTAKAACCSSTAVVPARLIRVSTGRCGLGLPPARPGGCGPPEASGVVTSNRTRAPDQGALGAYERGRFPRAVSSARAHGRVTLVVIL